MNEIFKKVLSLENLTLAQAVKLYNETPLIELISLANEVRYILNPQKKVSWQIDRNINYSNICISNCLFCNFHCKLSEKEKIIEHSIEDYRVKIFELIDKGGEQILLQGGNHPHRGIEYFEDLFISLKKIHPNLKLNALGPVEVAHIAKLSSLSYEQVLHRLRIAGLSTFPGPGAEILVNRVRKIISPNKATAEQWLEIMGVAHKMGFSTTATMVYGTIETIEERMEHLIHLRDLQSKKPKNHPGFRAFIHWPMQILGTKLEKYMINKGLPIPIQSKNEYLRMTAISRIILNNIPHIQSSWLTMGITTAQIALSAGADDMGSIMIEENIVSSTGLKNTLDAETMVTKIKEAGFEPWLRDQEYRPLP